MIEVRRQGRFWRLLVTASVLCTGVLSNHLSCSMLVQDAVANGFSQFLSDGTFDLLTVLVRPDQAGDGGSSNGGNDGGSDPFMPPPTQT